MRFGSVTSGSVSNRSRLGLNISTVLHMDTFRFVIIILAYGSLSYIGPRLEKCAAKQQYNSKQILKITLSVGTRLVE